MFWQTCFKKKKQTSSHIVHTRVWQSCLWIFPSKIYFLCLHNFYMEDNNFACMLMIAAAYYTFIAQFGGRHEDLFNPENSCRQRTKPEVNMNFLGWTNLHVSGLTGQLIVYYTESWRSTSNQRNMHWIKVLHRAKPVLWHHGSSRHRAVPWDMTGRYNVWRETQRFVFPPRDFSWPIIFLSSSYQLYKVW